VIFKEIGGIKSTLTITQRMENSTLKRVVFPYQERRKTVPKSFLSINQRCRWWV